MALAQDNLIIPVLKAFGGVALVVGFLFMLGYISSRFPQ
jgi:hypothetical protein